MASNGVPDFPPPENPDDPGRGPLVMGITWSMLVVATAFVVLRCIVRVRKRSFGADDWTMVVALVIQMGCQACYTVAHHWGAGKHDRDLTYFPQLHNIQKWGFIVVVPNMAASAVARISIALLLIRLFGSRVWFKWFLIVYTSVQTILIIAFIPVLWTQADPVEALWNPFMPARRRSTAVSGSMAYAIQAMLTLSDLLFVLFPVIIIFKLNMPMRRKIGLAMLMALSLITMGLSLMKTLQVRIANGRSGGNSDDVQYETVLLKLYSGVEQCMVIILGCVPTLKPLVQMDFSYFSNAASSVVKLFSFKEWTRKGASSQSSKPSASDYYELQLPSQGQFATDSEIAIVPAVAKSESKFTVESDLTYRETGPYVRQTDQYSLSNEEKGLKNASF